MGAAIDRITARLAAGENVKPSEYAAAQAEDAFAELQAEAEANRLAKRAEDERLAGIEATIAQLADDIDTASDALESALVTAIAALDEAEAARTELERVAQAGCSVLAHEYQYFAATDRIMSMTGGRVVFDRLDNVATRSTRKLAVGPEWITWRAARLAERAEAEST